MPAPLNNARRQDAQQNRSRLIEAALSAFATGDESEATLKAIAKRAGVGIGTLYRHFPTREALVEAAYRDEIARLEQSATVLLQEHAPDRALRLWMDRLADYVAAKRGMADTLRAIINAGTIDSTETRDEMIATIQTLLDANVEANTTRDDIAAIDVFSMLAGIFLATETNPDPQQAHRLLDLLMAGLVTSSTT
jgi:AcrR family transcriptional regulator